MPYFIIPLITGIIIQLIKSLLDYVREKKIHIEILRRPGGFPSVHSGISSSILTLVFFVEGYNSLLFAIVFGFSILFWYDSMNVRYEAGKHAKYINKISEDLKHILNLTNKPTNLKERLGHTIYEVAGGIIIGMLITIILHYLFY